MNKKKTENKKRKSKSEYLREWRQKNPGLVKWSYDRDLERKRWRYKNDDEYRQRILDQRKQRWNNPEFRKKRAFYMKEYRKRNKIQLEPIEKSERTPIGKLLDQILESMKINKK